MKCMSSELLTKIIKAIVLISLIITFGFFIKEVWTKFTDKATNYMQSFKKVDAYEVPTVTICFNPSIKPSMRKRYNLSGMDWKNLVNSNDHIKSMTKMFQDAYYQHGRDFTFVVSNYKLQPVEIHEGTENIIEYPKGAKNKITVNKFHSYLSGSCYSIKPSVLQSPDQFFGFGLVFNDSLKQTKDEPKNVKAIFTSKTNVYGIIRGTWVEGDQFETSFSLEGGESVFVNLRELQYHLLSSPPNCEQISHYECLGYGIEKILKNEKFCISTLHGHSCVNKCPKVCLPLVFQNFVELISLNVTIPLCETGEENRCIAVIMYFQLIELSKNCSTKCTIIKYEGIESGK